MRDTHAHRVWFRSLAVQIVVLGLFLVGLLVGLLQLRSEQAVDDLPPRKNGPTVVLTSCDGVKSSVLADLLAAGQLPNLERLMAIGVSTLAAQTVDPSLTLPAHTSLLTGQSVADHGITWNNYRPDKALDVPTVFDYLGDAGYRTTMVMGKTKLRQISTASPTLLAATYIDGEASQVVRSAVETVLEFAPHLLFIHIRDPDAAGHAHGWGNVADGIEASTEYREALTRCDDAVGYLKNSLDTLGLWPTSVVIVTSDHGGHDRIHGTGSPEDMTIPWIAGGGLVTARGTLVEPVSILDTTPTILRLFDLPIPPDLTGQPIPLRN